RKRSNRGPDWANALCAPANRPSAATIATMYEAFFIVFLLFPAAVPKACHASTVDFLMNRGVCETCAVLCRGRGGRSSPESFDLRCPCLRFKVSRSGIPRHRSGGKLHAIMIKLRIIAAAVVAAVPAVSHAQSPAHNVVTFSKDVAPILQRSCQS